MSALNVNTQQINKMLQILNDSLVDNDGVGVDEIEVPIQTADIKLKDIS